MYATLGQWDEVARVRKLMRDRGVKKEPGCSWVGVARSVHVPEVQEVYMYLEQLVIEMRRLGYVPDTKFVLQIWNLNIKSMPCPPMPCVAAMLRCAAAAVCCGSAMCGGVLWQCGGVLWQCGGVLWQWCGGVGRFSGGAVV
ncbi:hypothetical protein Lal_00021292 [Lupinus albus]|nr:hypothetical protein Lal_00021292 [Lupinus albus]